MSENDLLLFRRQGAQYAEAEQFTVAPFVDDGGRSLYLGYLGRVDLLAGQSIDVFVNDSSGSGAQSVWYDGIGYASILSTIALVGDYNDGIEDAADYTIWRDNLDTDHELPNDPIGGTIGCHCCYVEISSLPQHVRRFPSGWCPNPSRSILPAQNPQRILSPWSRCLTIRCHRILPRRGSTRSAPLCYLPF